VTFFFAARHRFPALQLDIEFELPSRGITALFGPSGSGKSSILAMIAGLLRPDEARIGIDGVVLADLATGLWVPPEKRRVALVFQDARLFPHMTVEGNLRYGLNRRKTGDIGFDAVLELLGLGALLPRRPHTLSGGQRQLVAIGRALLSQPHLLLMDEPLAGLDAARKADILPYLARLPTALGLPLLYVTHAWDEVAQLADTLVLIEAGRVAASGPLAAIAGRPDTPLAQRADAGAVLACRIAGHDPARGLTRLGWGAVSLLVPQLTGRTGTAVRVRIPAREVILARASATGLADSISLHNILAGTVRAIAQDAVAAMVEVDVGGVSVLARVTPDAVQRLGLASGGPVLAMVKSMSVEVLPTLAG
jgi:molybdate transport system ATP-binding protein